MQDEHSAAEVPAELDGTRADRVVAVVFGLARSESGRLVDAGAITVAGEPVSRSTRLAAGTRIDALIPEAGPVLEPVPLDFAVAYVDHAVVVVDKPAGLIVHPGAGTSDPTLVAGLVHRFPELADLADHRWGLVHRLDRDTSGLLMVARTAAAHTFLQEELRRRLIERTYLCIVDGVPDGARGTVDAPIGRDPHHPVRMALLQDGRPARTHFRRLAEWPNAALLEVKLETGRTHQIRVHMASIDHPVVGDRTYGGRRGLHPADPGRQWLHAAELGFAHPTESRSITVQSTPPHDLRLSLRVLGEPDVGELPDWSL